MLERGAMDFMMQAMGFGGLGWGLWWVGCVTVEGMEWSEVFGVLQVSIYPL